MKRPALPSQALYEQVAERLRERILSQQLAPGSWIDEQALTLEWGISRTPLREALKVLAAEGLITMKLRRGAYVTEVSDKDLGDVFHLLALLEADAAAVVAAHRSAQDLATLQAIHEELERSATQREAFFAANERFHLALLDIADNHWRKHLVEELRQVMKLHRKHSLRRDGRVAESLQEHRALMAALSAGDAERARLCMHEHLMHGRQAAGATL